MTGRKIYGAARAASPPRAPTSSTPIFTGSSGPVRGALLHRVRGAPLTYENTDQPGTLMMALTHARRIDGARVARRLAQWHLRAWSVDVEYDPSFLNARVTERILRWFTPESHRIHASFRGFIDDAGIFVDGHECQPCGTQLGGQEEVAQRRRARASHLSSTHPPTARDAALAEDLRSNPDEP